MKFKHVRDAIRGKDRQIEELTEALEHCLLACETALCDVASQGDRDIAIDILDIIIEKIESVLDKA